MESLEKRSERFRIVFRFDGQKFQHPLQTTDRMEPEGCLARQTVVRGGTSSR